MRPRTTSRSRRVALAWRIAFAATVILGLASAAAAQHQIVGGHRLDRNPMVGSAGLNSRVDPAAPFRAPDDRAGAIDLRRPSAFRATNPSLQRPFESGLQIGGDPYISYYDPRTGTTVLQENPLATPIYKPLEEPVYIDRSASPTLRVTPTGRMDTSARAWTAPPPAPRR